MDLRGCYDLQSMDDTRHVAENRKQGVDEEVGMATSLKENTKRRENDGKNDLADVAALDVSAAPVQCYRVGWWRKYLRSCEGHV
jgi:hypothetical protein